MTGINVNQPSFSPDKHEEGAGLVADDPIQRQVVLGYIAPTARVE